MRGKRNIVAFVLETGIAWRRGGGREEWEGMKGVGDGGTDGR